MNDHLNRVRIKALHNHLAELQDKVVYVGGAVVSLYADRPTPGIRPTEDIDVIIEILNYQQRSRLEEQLRRLGFQHDTASSIVCRYHIQGIFVDIMPTNDTSIGFHNIWYAEGYQKAIPFDLDERTTIRILPTTYLIATKIEAFRGRGNNDGRTSHDFEDLIFLLENRSSISDELYATEGRLRTFLQEFFAELLRNPYLQEWIECQLDFQETSRPLLQQIRAFAA